MKEQIESYSFFASLFFNLPDKEFVEKVLSMDYSSDAPGMELIKSYIESVKDKDIDKIVDEIAVDRTWLIHGLYREGPRPPYEMVYYYPVRDAFARQGDIPEAAEKMRIRNMRSLTAIYREAGMTVGENAHQPPDYLGLELVFMEELYKQGEGTFEKRKEFVENHLGRFGVMYADEMIKFARTDFWRGIAFLFKAFLEEEIELYS